MKISDATGFEFFSCSYSLMLICVYKIDIMAEIMDTYYPEI